MEPPWGSGSSQFSSLEETISVLEATEAAMMLASVCPPEVHALDFLFLL